ncbi:uncharacterized protein Z520_09025 [Fonsecaea multimorphosa CBS 102226]|uniref:BD-FAE-like domain-containing protein n=1 Tax=Fonsecaea multimorphosa CBS 102226 TaxID=1442371 RepID=A0A0D2JX64_9EURO|nr:uncharacterized protein Z520_09025 [Fonsecaea multimorphosa CBS 102226]KIX95109.1 hypothetical protein Z520_09025 [Fonsecaea multimorphosa CBS 102226]OAL20830.1 hypothetical protein AYO22_08458 [Fonsecaea multimorphosa]
MNKLEIENAEANTIFKTALKDAAAWNESLDWLPVHTFVYREVDGIKIEADVYVPDTPVGQLDQRPVVLFIHGGGWMGGIRTDIPRTILYEFLIRGFIFVSIDYRLVPEADFVTGQLDDITSVETWIREKLQASLQDRNLQVLVNTDSMIVVGASAGAHLASLTPKIWQIPPKALLLLAGPSNLLAPRVPKRSPPDGRLAPLLHHVPLDPSPEFIKSAMFDKPQTNTIPAVGLEGFLQPRSLLHLSRILKQVTSEFLLRGIVDGKLPEKGSVPEDEIKYISAFYTDPITSYPPTFQIIGDSDEAWDASQLTSFHDKLRQNGIPSAVLVVPEAVHAFENDSKVGDPVHLKYLATGVDFVCRFVGENGGEKSKN